PERGARAANARVAATARDLDAVRIAQRKRVEKRARAGEAFELRRLFEFGDVAAKTVDAAGREQARRTAHDVARLGRRDRRDIGRRHHRWELHLTARS